MYIAIAGNIGSGKTTLTRMLAERYKWEPRFESVDFNPYLDDYYKDIARWSFGLEVYFLKQRFKDLVAIQQSAATVVQDRSIFEGVYVFAANNKAMGNMSDRDFETYMDLFGLMMDTVKYPDLLVYLRAPVPHLVRNIQKRGRGCEQTMPIEYLENLNRRYEDFVFRKYEGRTLVVDVEGLDFQHRPQDFQHICDRIDARLFGLF